MNVLLLHPPYTRPSYFVRYTVTEALTGIFLAPVLRDRHALRLVDLRVTPDLQHELGDFTPDAVIVPVMPLTFGSLDTVLGRLRARFPGVRVLLVGAAEYGVAHLLERPLDFLHPAADALVPAFALHTLQRIVPEVLAAWDTHTELEQVDGIWFRGEDGQWTPTPDVPHVFGDIGVPDRSLLARARGGARFFGMGDFAYLMYVNGCRFNCRFCPMSKAGADIFVRSLGDVIEELEGMTERNVFLADFEPLQAPDAMLRLADAIAASGIRKRFFMLTRADSAVDNPHVLERWKEIGLDWVFLGIDGHSTTRLREIRKSSALATHEAAIELLRRMGMTVASSITISTDFDKHDFAEVRAAARRLRAHVLDFTVETPMVGTRYHDEARGQLTTRDMSLFDMYHAVLPTRLPLDSFYREMTRLHLLGWSKSTPAILRMQPLRDILHNTLIAPAVLRDSLLAARDHGRRTLLPTPARR